MKDLIHRISLGYRPLQQRGLLLDGQYRSSDIPFRSECSGSGMVVSTDSNHSRRRMLIAALAAAGLLARFASQSPGPPQESP